MMKLTGLEQKTSHFKPPICWQIKGDIFWSKRGSWWNMLWKFLGFNIVQRLRHGTCEGLRWTFVTSLVSWRHSPHTRDVKSYPWRQLRHTRDVISNTWRHLRKFKNTGHKTSDSMVWSFASDLSLSVVLLVSQFPLYVVVPHHRIMHVLTRIRSDNRAENL